MPKSSKKEEELQAKINELTLDVQRQRADFENYRKRIDVEKAQLTDMTKAATVMKLLPIIDTIERAVAHAPADLANNTWVQGVTSIAKNLEKSLNELGLARITAAPGTPFDPNLHEAVMMDEEAQGNHEVVAEELRAGYKMGDNVVRPSMVKVTRGELSHIKFGICVVVGLFGFNMVMARAGIAEIIIGFLLVAAAVIAGHIYLAKIRTPRNPMQDEIDAIMAKDQYDKNKK